MSRFLAAHRSALQLTTKRLSLPCWAATCLTATTSTISPLTLPSHVRHASWKKLPEKSPLLNSYDVRNVSQIRNKSGVSARADRPVHPSEGGVDYAFERSRTLAYPRSKVSDINPQTARRIALKQHRQGHFQRPVEQEEARGNRDEMIKQAEQEQKEVRRWKEKEKGERAARATKGQDQAAVPGREPCIIEPSDEKKMRAWAKAKRRAEEASDAEEGIRSKRRPIIKKDRKRADSSGGTPSRK